MTEYTAIDRYVPRNAKTKKLYDLEDMRNELIKGCANEYKKVVQGGEEIDTTHEGIPSQLLNILESFDVEQSRAAAKAFLKAHP